MPSRTTIMARDAHVIAGIGKRLQNVSSLPIAGSAFTPADLVKLVQSRIDAANETATTEATWRSTVAQDRALNTALAPVIRGLRQYVINVFGETSPALADFGFTPPKHTTRTPEEKVAAAAKARATRAARHTMGSQQKKTVTGAVTGIVVTPVTAAPPAATTPVSPGAPATSAGTTAGSTPHTP
jgi:hypothetical protein